ncbi:MAG: hypothetical protein WCL51_03775 [Bacteroidota bacterium]
MKFRNLKAEEIDVRVDRISEKGVWLLLYKNARVDMALLDEVVGPENWQRTHSVINNNLFCNVSIWNDKINQWVMKQDVGVESMSAKEKGEASDSFKRTCTNWGIGRELYNAPKIFVVCETLDDKGKFKLKKSWQFSDIKVSYIKTSETKEIEELAISDKDGTIVFSNMGKSYKKIDPSEKDEVELDINAKLNKPQRESIKLRIESMKFTVAEICESYKINSLDEMTIVQMAACNTRLNKIEDDRKKASK